MTTPIALYAYNRPSHLQLALETLTRCERFAECQLYVFCDGPKRPEHSEGVAAARQVAREWATRCGAMVVERDENLGLARSIVTGVTDLCEQYGRVIVVEDDLAVSPDFLNYMLQALDRYEAESNVYQVSGYMFPVVHPDHPDAFFLPLTTTWGWATWARAWRIFDWNAVGALEQLTDRTTRRAFDLDDSYPFTRMLHNRLAGKNQSWGILWYWAVFREGGLVLHPRRSLVWMGGFDGTGVHSGQRNPYPQPPLSIFAQNRFDASIVWPPTVIADTAGLQRIAQTLLLAQRHRTWASRLKRLVCGIKSKVVPG